MIRFEHVTKYYDQNVGLEDASVQIHKGDFVFLVGPSGAGKSTFIKLILKEIQADSGKIYVDGQDITRLSNREIPGLRRKIGTVFQDFRLLPKKTVYENVALAMEILHKTRRQIRKKVPQVLSLVGISDKADQYPDELSAGEQQRVAIARAIINNPTLLIADEPTGNLDPDTAAEIMDLLNQINMTGTTIVMVTHAKDIVDRMQRRVVAIEKGHIVRDEFGQYGFAEEAHAAADAASPAAVLEETEQTAAAEPAAINAAAGPAVSEAVPDAAQETDADLPTSSDGPAASPEETAAETDASEPGTAVPEAGQPQPMQAAAAPWETEPRAADGPGEDGPEAVYTPTPEPVPEAETEPPAADLSTPDGVSAAGAAEAIYTADRAEIPSRRRKRAEKSRRRRKRMEREAAQAAEEAAAMTAVTPEPVSLAAEMAPDRVPMADESPAAEPVPAVSPATEPISPPPEAAAVMPEPVSPAAEIAPARVSMADKPPAAEPVPAGSPAEPAAESDVPDRWMEELSHHDEAQARFHTRAFALHESPAEETESETEEVSADEPTGL